MTRGYGWLRWCALAFGMSIVLLLYLAPATLALPPSLRSESDLEQLAETFMASLVANDVRGAYGAAAPYWSKASPPLAESIAVTRKGRETQRKLLGLSLGYERLALERAGRRLVRLTYLERFDAGGRLWRFLFYRADASWQLIELQESDDWSGVFAPD